MKQRGAEKLSYEADRKSAKKYLLDTHSKYIPATAQLIDNTKNDEGAA